MKLRNEAADMEIGVMTYDSRVRMYVQKGQERRVYGSFTNYEQANKFLERLREWDEAGGSDQ